MRRLSLRAATITAENQPALSKLIHRCIGSIFNFGLIAVNRFFQRVRTFTIFESFRFRLLRLAAQIIKAARAFMNRRNPACLAEYRSNGNGKIGHHVNWKSEYVNYFLGSFSRNNLPHVDRCNKSDNKCNYIAVEENLQD